MDKLSDLLDVSFKLNVLLPVSLISLNDFSEFLLSTTCYNSDVRWDHQNSYALSRIVLSTLLVANHALLCSISAEMDCVS